MVARVWLAASSERFQMKLTWANQSVEPTADRRPVQSVLEDQRRLPPVAHACCFVDTKRERLNTTVQVPEEALACSELCLFLYLFLAVAVNYKGGQPTAWRVILQGEIGMGVVYGAFWLAIALAFGALGAAVLGIVRHVLWKSK